MPSTSATAPRTRTGIGTRIRTGGPGDDGSTRLENLAGWTLVVVLAMLLTQTGLL
ncbi:membrane protein CrgA [Streptomyces sp. NBRC 110611]|uniref:SCO1431 family membrane protein n=1 Tax=Streptomyces sp. NBRC 110611 TaxID=1621259 RepID=UPI000857D22E|nr:SCO1431 family membrane protein [Streptomyces sp. NBRC 110611]GAU68005.1 membrane protein CrgA [Streptomyces sp. NBRC 110611]